ncbi:MAG: glycosyltransferase family 61 protein [Cyanobium sp.]
MPDPPRNHAVSSAGGEKGLAPCRPVPPGRLRDHPRHRGPARGLSGLASGLLPLVSGFSSPRSGCRAPSPADRQGRPAPCAGSAEHLADRITGPAGAPPRCLLPYRPRAGGTNIRCHSLLAAASHRHQHASEAPFDAISPIHLKQLAQRLGSVESGCTASGLPRRVFVSSRGATSRRIANESEISSHLEGCGFSTIQLEKLSLPEQIRLFRNATHVIGVHGAGFTNLMHASNCSVLELFASAHGIRPDYFQIASIQKLSYHFHSLSSLNSSHDIHLPRQLIDDFLAIAPI